MVMAEASSLAVEFGARLKARRKELGMTLDALAAECGMGKTSIWQAEHGVSMPGIDTALKIARALDVPVGWLIEGETRATTVGERRIAAAMTNLRRAIEANARFGDREQAGPDPVAVEGGGD
jgi:transcriptional regulator with XRE-family HTH domain